jgi:hypothetical protein
MWQAVWDMMNRKDHHKEGGIEVILKIRKLQRHNRAFIHPSVEILLCTYPFAQTITPPVDYGVAYPEGEGRAAWKAKGRSGTKGNLKRFYALNSYLSSLLGHIPICRPSFLSNLIFSSLLIAAYSSRNEETLENKS